ncbi:hypothetical protein DSO57_1023244 [Entomophthora muscae]|uniref:Uncharacterized protein n=1 Tax=Entomophthora muscae TaxID=34485 RepID=A0ACC2RHJ5_9FUNG|nr:hypothetical protein DSO57_1023244 [Entomophthora muscae]
MYESDYIPQQYFPNSMPYYIPHQLMYEQPIPTYSPSYQPKPASPTSNALSSTPPAPTKQIQQPYYAQPLDQPLEQPVLNHPMDPSFEQQPLDMPAYWPEAANWNQMMPPQFQPANAVFTPPMFGMNPPKRVFSFVSMTHSKTKKRHRRRYDEIDRVYKCSHQNCSKSYGTLNNLNAHILMQSHGPKRSAFEFKDMAARRSSDALQPTL